LAAADAAAKSALFIIGAEFDLFNAAGVSMSIFELETELLLDISSSFPQQTSRIRHIRDKPNPLAIDSNSPILG